MLPGVEVFAKSRPDCYKQAFLTRTDLQLSNTLLTTNAFSKWDEIEAPWRGPETSSPGTDNMATPVIIIETSSQTYRLLHQCIPLARYSTSKTHN